ncbi:hypothetical protein [Chitinophaga sp.]|uniref:terpene synthase family protein n=1 Tax=Chitinophaga sp. TaxID=1869181 RepID=UPI0031D2EF14
MKTINVPQLYCPFESRISPFVDRVDRHTTNWLHRFQLLSGEELYEKYANYKFAWMTCRTYPDADYDFLCAANNLNSLLFVMDDLLDHASSETADYRTADYVQGIIGGFVNVLRFNKRVPVSVNPIMAAFSDFWEKMRRLSSASWQCQFTLSLKAVFEAGMWEIENSRAQRHPSMLQYMKMRPYFAAANLATDLLEVATKQNLPVFVLQNEEFQRLVELARRTICWSNDLFSLSKELEHGDEHNLVVVIEHERNISLEQAIEETARIHDREIAQFNELKAQLPSFGIRIDTAIQTHLDAMGTMLRGFMDWSIYDTARYEFNYVTE